VQKLKHLSAGIPTLRRWIRADELGAYLTPAMVPLLLAAGADACVTKPLDLDVVRRKLGRLAAANRVTHSLTGREG